MSTLFVASAAALEPPDTEGEIYDAGDGLSGDVNRMIDNVIDDRGIVEGEVDGLAFMARPQPWQMDPAALKQTAVDFTEHEDGRIEAVLPDGTHTVMTVHSTATHDEIRSTPSSLACTESQSAYEPSTPSTSTRGTASFYISTGCSEGDWAQAGLESRYCPVTGCRWLSAGSGMDADIPNSGITTYLTDFHCRDGSHDWRMQAYMSGSTRSNVRYLTNFC